MQTEIYQISRVNYLATLLCPVHKKPITDTKIMHLILFGRTFHQVIILIIAIFGHGGFRSDKKQVNIVCLIKFFLMTTRNIHTKHYSCPDKSSAHTLTMSTIIRWVEMLNYLHCTNSFCSPYTKAKTRSRHFSIAAHFVEKSACAHTKRAYNINFPEIT